MGGEGGGEGGIGRTKKPWSLASACSTRRREDRRRNARAEAAAWQQCRIARGARWWHAKRVHRSLRMNPGTTSVRASQLAGRDADPL